MRACRLNADGLAEFTAWLDNTADQSGAVVPTELMQPGPFVELIEPAINLKKQIFGSRLQFAAYIDEAAMRPSREQLARDVGFWSWLTIFYFDEVCPKKPDGSRGRGALPRYVPSFDEWKRYYRHLLAGPWMIYRAHRDEPQSALALLSGPLAKPGEVVEQFAARMEWVTNPSVMGVVTRLYYDRVKGQLRKGAGGKGRGSARRLASVLWQFDRTFDLYSVPPTQLVAMLPGEFERFKPRAP